MAFIENTGLERLWGHIVHRLSLKADKEDVKTLSKTVAEIPQSDWNQNDETAKDYIKNRPFWEENYISLPIVLSDFGYAAGYTDYKVKIPYILEYDKPISLRVDGVVYEFDSYETSYVSSLVATAYSIGAPFVGGAITDSSEYPFTLIMFYDELGEKYPEEDYAHIEFADGTMNHTVEICDCVVHQLDEKYIPDDIKLSKFENDLFYPKGYKEFITLTKDDFSEVIDSDGNSYTVYKGSPKLDWLTSADNVKIVISATFTSGDEYNSPEGGELLYYEEIVNDDDTTVGHFVEIDEFPIGIITGIEAFNYEELVEEDAFYVQCFVSYTDFTNDFDTLKVEIYKHEEAKIIPSEVLPSHDWNTLENRPFYEIPEVWNKAELIDDTWSGRATCKLASTPIEWAKDNQYRIRVDGIEYNFDGMKKFAGTAATGAVNVYYIGATYIPFNSNMDFSEYPFCLLTTDFENIYAVFEDATLNHTVEFFESEGIIKQIDPKYIPDSVKAQSDWSQSDSTASDYIKNRTHWEEENIIDIAGLEYILIEGEKNEVYTYSYDPIPLGLGQTWKVYRNSTAEFGEYEVQIDENGELYIGDLDLSLVPFHITTTSITVSKSFINQFNVAGMKIVGVSGTYSTGTTVHQLDPKYIKDMYYESEPVEIIDLEQQTINGFSAFEGSLYAAINAVGLNYPSEGDVYIVNWDGVEYTVTAYYIPEERISFIGNENYLYTQSGGEIPFCIVWAGDIFIVTESTNTSHSISIKHTEERIHHIDPKYIKDMYYEYIVPNTDTVIDIWFNVENDYQWFESNDFYLENFLVEGATYTVNIGDETYTCTTRRSNWGELYIGNQAISGWSEDSFPEIIESNEPFFLWTYEEEFDYGICIQTAGKYSILIKGAGEKLAQHKIDMKYMPESIIGNIRNQWNSINDIYNNIDSGYNNKMDKENPTGTGSFSMNRKENTTIGNYSHAEGWDTTASGFASHAEGYFTTAAGRYSHAEGYYTTAASDYSHAEGKYNIEDTENKYAHIVGNGDYSARSNAHTLDWDGNAWYAGSVEGTALILSSPNGTRFSITVGDDGVLSATEITE